MNNDAKNSTWMEKIAFQNYAYTLNINSYK